MIERVKKVIAYTGLSDRAFAIKCGINQPTLFNQLKGLRNVSLDTIRAIANTFSEVSGDWLLTGHGEMIKVAPTMDIDRIATLVDTIATLQKTIGEKDKTIAILTDQLQQLKNQLHK